MSHASPQGPTPTAEGPHSTTRPSGPTVCTASDEAPAPLLLCPSGSWPAAGRSPSSSSSHCFCPSSQSCRLFHHSLRRGRPDGDVCCSLSLLPPFPKLLAVVPTDRPPWLQLFTHGRPSSTGALRVDIKPKTKNKTVN